jgi:hypothetical protein
MTVSFLRSSVVEQSAHNAKVDGAIPSAGTRSVIAFGRMPVARHTGRDVNHGVRQGRVRWLPTSLRSSVAEHQLGKLGVVGAIPTVGSSLSSSVVRALAL